MIIALLRTIILYLLLVVGFRLLGKRQVGELEPTELVLALIISDLASVPMQDNGIPLLAGVIPIVTLLCLTMIISVVMTKSVHFRSLLCGRPSILVQNGRLNIEQLSRNRVTIDELLEELRIKGYTELRSIRYAILETSGQLSVLPFPDEKPVTAAQMNLHPPDSGLPTILINDGRLLSENLKARGYERVWLQKQLDSHGAGNLENVFLLTVDDLGQTYCVIKGDGK